MLARHSPEHGIGTPVLICLEETKRTTDCQRMPTLGFQLSGKYSQYFRKYILFECADAAICRGKSNCAKQNGQPGVCLVEWQVATWRCPVRRRFRAKPLCDHVFSGRVACMSLHYHLIISISKVRYSRVRYLLIIQAPNI
jgi:hypothetical protein